MKGDSQDSSGLNGAVRKWLSLSSRQKINYMQLLGRGWMNRGHFGAAQYPLLGRNVWLNTVNGRLDLGRFVTISDGAGLSVFARDADAPAHLSVGDYTIIGGRTHINCQYEIRIGSRCAISWDCEILDTDIHTIVFEDGTKSAPARVVIGEHVWIGTRAIILKGVTIGDGAVIGAGSVVTQDILPFHLAVGNPARPIRKIRDWLP